MQRAPGYEVCMTRPHKIVIQSRNKVGAAVSTMALFEPRKTLLLGLNSSQNLYIQFGGACFKFMEQGYF